MNVMSTTPMILPRNSPHSGGRSLLKPPEKPPLGKGKERKAGGCRCGNATACPGMPFKTINFKKIGHGFGSGKSVLLANAVMFLRQREGQF